MNIFLALAQYLKKISSKISCRRQLKIHGPHRGHRCFFKILLKIFIKISSIYDAIHKKNPSQKRGIRAYFGQGFLFKDFGSRVIEYISCVSNISTKISPKISCARATPKYPFNIRLNSDDPCPPCAPWNIQSTLRVTCEII